MSLDSVDEHEKALKNMLQKLPLLAKFINLLDRPCNFEVKIKTLLDIDNIVYNTFKKIMMNYWQKKCSKLLTCSNPWLRPCLLISLK